jgi:hypothetical protein
MLALLAISFHLVITKPAMAADSPCELRIDGASLPATWSPAIDDLRAIVTKLTASSTDCRVISVSRTDDGATVVFTTADGRTARRYVAAPRELLPTVEALLILWSEPLAPAHESDEAVTPVAPPHRDEARRAPTVSSTNAANDSVAAADTKEQPPPRSTALVLGAGGGVKGSWPNDTVAAVGQIFAGVSFPRWELAGFARWEIEHDAEANADVAAPSGKLRYSALGGGVMAGRRQPLGPVVLIGGARAALFDAEEERIKRQDGRQGRFQHEEFLDPRLGLYAGCIFVASSRLRVRVQMDGDAGVVVHRSELAELPAFPRWNLGVSLGAETSFFP